MKTVAVFGGSFNPPHVGHVLAAAYVLTACEVDEFLVVPCFIHPFAKSLAPYEDRFEMCRLAFGWMPQVTISRVEQELGGESRTLRTLRHIAQSHDAWHLRMVVGADVLGEAPRWYGFDEIVRLAPLILLGRVGVTAQGTLPQVLPEVSSTRIRDSIRAGRIDDVAALLPRGVLEYVRARGLYT